MRLHAVVTFLALALLAARTTPGATRSAPDYTVNAEAMAVATVQTATTLVSRATLNYPIAGVGLAPPGAVTNRQGYVPQLEAETALTLTPSASPVPEGSIVLLTPRLSLADGTYTAPNPETIDWTILFGPVSNFDTSGTVTVAFVYADTNLGVRADSGPLSTQLVIPVTNSSSDNVPPYGGDGIDDIWQQLYFGDANTNGLADADPDGDKRSNRFEYLTGFSPIDGTQHFAVAVLDVTPAYARLLLNKVKEDTIYRLDHSTNLTNWAHFLSFTGAVTALNQTIDDTSTVTRVRFYRVGVE